jgi:hypothetical protein
MTETRSVALGALMSRIRQDGLSRRRMMFDLVLESFMIGLTPLALDLAWNLASGIEGVVESTLTRVAEAARRRR